MISELCEITGILILDVSLIDTKEYLVFIAEIIGFLVLMVASALNLIYPEQNLLHTPIISWKTDISTQSDCLGLLLLIVVSVGQYSSKVYKSYGQKNSYLLLPHSRQDTERDSSSIEKLQYRGHHQVHSDKVAEKQTNGHFSLQSQIVEATIGVHGDMIIEKARGMHDHAN
jgi:hypothetical protein